MGVYFAAPIGDVKYRHGFKVDWYTYSNAHFGPIKSFIAITIRSIFTAIRMTSSFTAEAVKFSHTALKKIFSFMAAK